MYVCVLILANYFKFSESCGFSILRLMTKFEMIEEKIRVGVMNAIILQNLI